MGDSEMHGAKPRDHQHVRHHFVRRAHRDWRVWVVVLLMVALMLVYVFTKDLALAPRQPARAPTPAVNAP